MPLCIHCIKEEATTDDHIVPSSWYPPSTPPTVQRLTAPGCDKCNGHFGQLEHDLLIRMGLSLDTSSEAAHGLDERVFRSLGIDVTDRPSGELAIRERERAKLRSEFLAYEEVCELPGRIRGLGPPLDQPQGPAVLIPWASLSMMAEKIARGCEYRYRNQKRYVQHPYGLLTLIPDLDEFFDNPMLKFTELMDFGPGCQVRRGSPPEDPNVVRYFITIWGVLHFKVLIDFQDYLDELAKTLPKPGGVLPLNHPAMKVPEYL
jgi:hypothetical protein